MRTDILLASYNGENYIAEQLDSLLNQTEQEFRILIHDDGSTDRTAAIIREYQERFPDKILLIEDGIRWGSPAENFMSLIGYEVRNRRAEYVMFCDQDDFWFADKVRATLEAMRVREKAAGGRQVPVLVFSDYIAADEQLHPLKIRENHLQIAGFHLDLPHLLVQNYVTGCTMMVNRAALEWAGAYDPRMQMHDWWIALYTGAAGEIFHLNRKLMYYRQHGKNDVGAKDVKSLKYRLKKLRDPAIRLSMQKNLDQASLLKERHYQKLPAESRSTLDRFLEVQNSPKWKKICILAKGRYLKSDLVRSIGELILS